jgi:hypothetical protein
MRRPSEANRSTTEDPRLSGGRTEGHRDVGGLRGEEAWTARVNQWKIEKNNNLRIF